MILLNVENVGHLSGTLNRLIFNLTEVDDLQCKRLVISLLAKMVYCWGGSRDQLEIPVVVGTGNPNQKSVSMGPKAKDNLKREPLDGFDNFIFEILVPRIFEVPTKISRSDAQGKLVFLEVVFFHITTYSVFKEIYVSLLTTNYFGANGFPTDLGGGFLNALARGEKNAVKKCLNVFTFLIRQFTRKSRSNKLKSSIPLFPTSQTTANIPRPN